MIIEIYRDFLRHLAKKSKVSLSEVDRAVKASLSKYSDGLPVDFYAAMTTCWPTKTMQAGPYELYPIDEILADDKFDTLHIRGFFLIGHSLNGDFLVIRTGKKWGEETRVCLVSHEHYLTDEMHPDECLVEITDDLLEFFYRAVEERYMPVDFFCAGEFSKLKKKHGPEKPPPEA